MNNFWAKVNLKEGENALEILEAFFKEFNSESSLYIKGRTAEMKIYFENPPIEIAKAIGKFDNLEFICEGKQESKAEDNNSVVAVHDDIIPKQTAVEAKEEAKSCEKETITDISSEDGKEIDGYSVEKEECGLETDESKESKKDIARNEVSQSISTCKGTNRAEIIRASRYGAIPEIPELMEIVEIAESYEDFVHGVTEWVGISNKYELFVNVLLAAAQVKKISWREINEELKGKGICISEYEKMCFNKQIYEKFENKKDIITFIMFIKAVAQFKTYSFQKKTAETKQEDVTGIIEENSKAVVYMSDIPEFQEAVKSIDKTKPVHERVKHVLSAMGWNDNQNNEGYKIIYNFTNAAICLKEMKLQIICDKCDIPVEMLNEVRMIFITFINNFVKKYFPDRRVRFFDFLKEMQIYIMNEDEIK